VTLAPHFPLKRFVAEEGGRGKDKVDFLPSHNHSVPWARKKGEKIGML